MSPRFKSRPVRPALYPHSSRDTIRGIRTQVASLAPTWADQPRAEPRSSEVIYWDRDILKLKIKSSHRIIACSPTKHLP
jgi:hypothetical protein